jgi:AcrR family transcriptional regulator
MVEAVARHGYAGTTLRELVSLAAVSKTTFYEHFSSKEECFLATFDEIFAQIMARVSAAYRQPTEPRERMVAALTTFMDVVVQEPAAASLAAVESLTLGRKGQEHLEQAAQGFEVMIRQSLEHTPGPREASPTTVRVIVAGIRGVVYRRLRAGTQEELPGLVERLVDWALGYQEPDSEPMRRAVSAAGTPAPPPPREGIGWEEPPDSRRSRTELSQRERIERAAARVAVERGYESLSIPAISAAAGTSNQTFYEHFSSKREAFVAAFEKLAGEALAVAATAFQAEAGKPEAFGVGIRVILEHLTANELLAHLVFFELQTAGPVAFDRADAMMDGFTAFLDPEILPDGLRRPQPRVIREAVVSGLWGAIQHEIAHGRLGSLPQLAPELTRIALAPSS